MRTRARERRRVPAAAKPGMQLPETRLLDLADGLAGRLLRVLAASERAFEAGGIALDPFFDVSDQIACSEGAHAPAHRPASRPRVDPLERGADVLRLPESVGRKARDGVAHVARGLVGLVAVREGESLRSFASKRPLGLAAKPLALLGASGARLAERDHGCGQHSLEVGVLEAIDAEPESEAPPASRRLVAQARWRRPR